MTMRRYQPRSPLQAIDPKAFFVLFAEPEEAENEQRGDATIVTVRGPLCQHGGWWEDSYEAILSRVAEACDQAASVVVLDIDSPGGDVLGCFDTARSLRALCTAKGKRLVAYSAGQLCSAAYALATAAEKIWASESAQVGSVGVIAARLDESRALEDAGLRVSLIASGARKADGASCAPMGDDELVVLQADVDGLAQEFFSLVSLHRPWMSPDSVEALQAGSFRGQAAVKAGLVDELGSFDDVIASLSAAQGDTMADDKEKDARDALAALAEDEERTDEERAKARRALAALDESDDEKAEDGDGEEKPAEDDKPADDEEQAAAAPATVSASTAGAIAAHGADYERRLARLEKSHEAEERHRLIVAHGGVPKGLAKLLASKPVDEVRAVLAELPKPKPVKLGDAAATVTVAGTRGASQDKASQLPPAEAKAMRLAMGMDQEKFGVVERGNALLLGAPEPTEGGE